MRTFDRLLFVAYLQAYAVCLVSLLSLYVIVDLFTNLDDFAAHSQGLMEILRHVGSYYGYKVVQIFDRLCEPIVLLAATFTVAGLQRTNELLPLLSAGVPTRRVILPIALAAAAMLGVGILNQEYVIPRISDALLADRDDPDGNKTVGAQGAYEPNGIHLEGQDAKRRGLEIKPFFCTVPEGPTTGLQHLSARQAVYLPATTAGPLKGGWLMTGVTPATLDPCPQPLVQLDPGRYFLPAAEVDFDVMTRNRNWFMFASTAKLKALLDRPGPRRLSSIAVKFHMRLTRPVLGMLLVVLGLALLLRDGQTNVFVGTGLCLVMCAVFFGAIFACQQLGDNEIISPALAAWGPVLLFGPPAFAMFDAMHT